MTPQGEAPVQPPGWFARNWKWAVPLGCGLPLLCCLSFTVVTLYTVKTAVEASGPYTDGFKRATTSAAVKAALGEPVTPGMMMSGSINESGSAGSAHIQVPLSGPKGKGTLSVDAERVDGTWKYERMEVEVDGAGRIDLLAGEGAQRGQQAPPRQERAAPPDGPPDEPPTPPDKADKPEAP